VSITQDEINCWRANYGLDIRTPADAMDYWSTRCAGTAPAGAVAALGLCIDEIATLRAQLAASETQAERMAKALRSAISVIERDGDPWNVCDDFRAALAEGEAG